MPYVDDPAIVDTERLLRRVPPRWWVYDDNIGRRRLSSGAFDEPEMSVDISSIRAQLGQEEVECLRGHGGFGLAMITAGIARANAQAVCRDPLPENAAHGIVFGKKTTGRKNSFCQNAVMLVEPEVR